MSKLESADKADMKRSAHRRLVALAAVVVLVAGCGDDAKAAGSRAAAIRRQQAQASAPAAVEAPSPPPTRKNGAVLPPVPPKLADILCDLAKWDAASKEDRRAAAKELAKRATGFELLRLEEFVCGRQSHEVAVFKHAKTDLEFVLVPAGSFDMGSPESEAGRQVFENLHTVTLTKPYLIARTECTQDAWRRVTGGDPSKIKGDDRPVESVSWEDAQTFCEKAGLSLPTEAQWERACRAGSSTCWFHGDGAGQLCDFAVFASAGADPRALETSPVAKKQPNAFGLYDTLGNVNEWCGDMMSPYPTAPATDPFTAIDATHKSPVFRGGSFRRGDVASRPAFRLSSDATKADATIGFRPAKTLSLD